MITKTMKLSDIKISDAFARTHVSERKLQKCRDYFEEFEKARPRNSACFRRIL